MRRMSRIVTGVLASAALLAAARDAKDNGLKVGDATPAYNPVHVSGPDSGSKACPV